MEEKCIGTICPLIDATVPAEKSPLKAKTYAILLKNFLYCRMPWAVPRVKAMWRKTHSSENPSGSSGTKTRKGESLNLQVGDWVEVRTEDEIKEMLDKHGKTRGLRFMPEMWKFCGSRQKIFKKIEKVKIEETGENRLVKSPTFFLEGVYCDGSFHDDCDRSCFLFWKEEWLKKVDGP
jgi:hypothetical protein